ncbi:MAG: hypothetical protein ABEL04_07215, partial [Salinibacter sp.]
MPLPAAGSISSGILHQWAARNDSPGILLIDEPLSRGATRMRQVTERLARPDDLVVFSRHRGAPQDYQIPSVQRHFTRPLVNEAGVGRGPGLKFRSSSSKENRST